MRERHVDTLLGSLAVFELGDGPATFLWPSLYVDHDSLMPLATELARTRRCILIDGPGHGRSAVPARRYTLADCARAAGQVLDELALDQVDWIGNAWGGHVGIHVALAAPARLRTLTIIGSPMQALSPAMRWKSRLGLGFLALGARDLVGTLVAKAMLSPQSPAEHHAYVRGCIRDAPPGGIRRAVRSISLGREDLTPVLARIAVPTLVIAGADDPMWPPDVAGREASTIPGARFQTVGAAAHLAPLERPRETLAVIADFLAAQEAPTLAPRAAR